MLLVGADSNKEKRIALQKLQAIPQTESLAIVATGKYIGEGFDYPRLDTLFLTMPIAWKGNIEQYAGRLHREYDGKSEVQIYDYIDFHVPLCDSMYRKRLKGYSAAGYGKSTENTTSEQASKELIYERDNYETCAIIDNSIVWYGNINFFGFTAPTANIIRIPDPKIAQQFTHTLTPKTKTKPINQAP